MSVDAMIEVLEAFKAGKPIEYRWRYANENVWTPTNELPDDFSNYEYRVTKPKPKNAIVVIIRSKD